MSTIRVRNFRAEDDLYQAASAKATKLGMSISTALRLLLRNFVHAEEITISEPQEIKNLGKSPKLNKIAKDYIKATNKLLANRNAITNSQKSLEKHTRRKK